MTWEPKSDADMIDERYNYFYINNVFGHFVKDTLEYFSDYLYPRFQWKVIGTYDKAVEYINKTTQYGREVDQAQRPAIILDPSGDFGFDEVYGKLLYRYPNLASGFVKYLYHPIYQDENIIITVGFSRMVGEFNFIGLMSSFYEYCDMRVYLNMIFGGLERPIYPRWFNSFIILPSEIKDYIYSNEYTGRSYPLNIDGTRNELIKSTNKNELVYPCTILPRYKLTSISDGSTKYGGQDNIADWKLNWVVHYEVEIPSFIVLESDYLSENLNVSIQYGSCYSENNSYLNNPVPETMSTFSTNINHGLDETSSSEIIIPDQATITNERDLSLKTRYYHIVTKEEADSTDTVIITIPEKIEDITLFSLYGKYGKLNYGDHYLIENQDELIIDKTYVTLEENDVLELFIYEEQS